MKVPINSKITELFTIAEFAEEVRAGTFIDWDGSGYYGTADYYDSDAQARPSEIYRGVLKNENYPYVHWFNK